MAAQVETMMYSKQGGVPWHRLGVSTDGAQTSEDAAEAAGIAWAVAKQPIFDGAGREIPGSYVVQRDSDGAHLGIVGDQYVPLQNAEAFAFLDSLAQDGIVRYETAGSLRGGRRVWMLAKMEEDWRIGDDDFKSYLLLANGHDGSLAVCVQPTNVRVVCSNTLASAIGSKGASALVRIRHTSSMETRMGEAARVLNITSEANRRQRDLLQRAIETQATAADVSLIVEELFGESLKSDSDRTRGAAERAVVDFKARFLLPEVRRTGQTAYALINAVTGYADHALRYQGDGQAKAERRMETTLWGGKAFDIKRQGVELVAAMVAERR